MHFFSFILCFVDRAPLYNLVNKANLVHNLFLVLIKGRVRQYVMCTTGMPQLKLILSIFINLYMFRATMCPKSGETAVFV